jgi:hypothetical protein
MANITYLPTPRVSSSIATSARAASVPAVSPDRPATTPTENPTGADPLEAGPAASAPLRPPALPPAAGSAKTHPAPAPRRPAPPPPRGAIWARTRSSASWPRVSRSSNPSSSRKWTAGPGGAAAKAWTNTASSDPRVRRVPVSRWNGDGSTAGRRWGAHASARDRRSASAAAAGSGRDTTTTRAIPAPAGSWAGEALARMASRSAERPRRPQPARIRRARRGDRRHGPQVDDHHVEPLQGDPHHPVQALDEAVRGRCPGRPSPGHVHADLGLPYGPLLGGHPVRRLRDLDLDASAPGTRRTPPGSHPGRHSTSAQTPRGVQRIPTSGNVAGSTAGATGDASTPAPKGDAGARTASRGAPGARRASGIASRAPHHDHSASVSGSRWRPRVYQATGGRSAWASMSSVVLGRGAGGATYAKPLALRSKSWNAMRPHSSELCPRTVEDRWQRYPLPTQLRTEP